MEVKLFKPQNPLLQNYIECLYTLKHSLEEGATTYLTFPSIFTIVVVSEMNQTIVNANNLLIMHRSEKMMESNLVCNFNQPVLVRYEGETSEIVIYFKPLGINAFLDCNLRAYGEGHFPSFEPFEDYKSAMAEILSMKTNEDKVKGLEDYWLSKLKGFEHPFLSKTIEDLIDEDNSSQSISEIAAKYAISRMTLNKLFNLHICKTPVQLRKIIRFRNAVKRHINAASENDLTGIAHSSDYFDQSHMIKDFKALTGYPPKTFFSRISRIENGRINWLFL